MKPMLVLLLAGGLLIWLLVQLRPNAELPTMGCIWGDCENGYGYYRWASGDYYMGEWDDKKRDGVGTLFWANGQKYSGHWQSGLMSGAGVMYYLHSPSKIGVWKENNFVALRRPTWQGYQENLAFAQAEMDKMLTDRPAMRDWLDVVSGELKGNLLRQIAGEPLKSVVFWQNGESSDFQIPKGVAAVHRSPSPLHEAAIWLQPDLSGEEAWASFIFELYNIRNAADFERINQDVAKGVCNEEQYVRRYAQLEYEALRQTNAFYRQTWLPACQKVGKNSNSRYWFDQLPQTFEAWIAQYNDRNGYPWHPYLTFYQQLLGNSIKKY
jgi:hypothetical protein